MERKLFCEISPLTYNISVKKCIIQRNIKDFLKHTNFSLEKGEILPVVLYRHSSLIRRKLGNVDMELQENKAINLNIAAPLVNEIIIKPGETFSFWKLVGNTTAKKGYKEGVTISNEKVKSGIGGGMCQFTNLIHWLVLHTPLDIVEHHHHDRFDLFPDYNRQVPFGTGTSIAYNYIDYRFENNTGMDFQLITYTTDTHLCGEIRAEKNLDFKYHIFTENEKFIKKNGEVYRTGNVYRKCVDVKTGNTISKELIRENYAKVLYDTSNLDVEEV